MGISILIIPVFRFVFFEDVEYSTSISPVRQIMLVPKLFPGESLGNGTQMDLWFVLCKAIMEVQGQFDMEMDHPGCVTRNRLILFVERDRLPYLSVEKLPKHFSVSGFST